MIYRWRLPIYLVALALALLLLAFAFLRLLLAPAAGTGTLLVLLSARQTDHVAATTVELRSGRSWLQLGHISQRDVRAAPQTDEAMQVRLAAGTYDAVRFGGMVMPLDLRVQRDLLTPVLITIQEGRPVSNRIYAGSENVSLGLNELAGNLREVPRFSLVDQFGRPFTNTSIAGKEVVLAAFHTRCRETCPIYTGLFLQLQKQLPPTTLIVEATVNPANDTPEVLRDYAGRVGASWTFVTGTPEAMAEFWRPFDVELTDADVHRSELALIDSHGFIRTYYLGVPDVGGRLPSPLQQQLSEEGQQQLRSPSGWGTPQLLEALRTMATISPPTGEGGGKAPSFTLSTLDGRRVSLDDFRGRPVLLNFWGSYCVPCRVEMPLIEKVAREKPNLAVLLVDVRDDPASARRLLSELAIRSTALDDGNATVASQYRVTGLPTTVFIRADGSIEGRHVGKLDEKTLRAHVAAIST